MSASVQQIQGIQIEDADMSRIEAEVEVLEAIDSTPSRLEPCQGIGVEHLYYTQFRSEGDQISSYVYITDDPETNLRELREKLELMVNERKNILAGSPQRDDLERAIALQSKIKGLGNAIKFKEQLLNLPNPALEENNPEITAALI